MTLEYLAEQKEKYMQKQQHFKNMEFDRLAADSQGIVDLIWEMEEYVKENVNGKEV